ncbi:MAG: glycosyltransferase family 1 protein [Caldiserica bacterium]|nr:MAG: glycosyltransferase family 1 protein [Caldisericota bacterium]
MKQNLNILHLHWGFPPIIGGVETHLTLLLPEVAKRGYRISLITCSTEKRSGEEDYNGIKLYRTPLLDLNWLYRRGLKGLENEIRNLYVDIIEKEKPDIIHAHNFHYFSRIHAEILIEEANKKGIPAILTAHNVWEDIDYLEINYNIKWTRIIAVSHYIKKELMGIGIESENISVVHHGTDIEKFNPSVSPEPILKRFPYLRDKRVVLHPARIGRAKGVDVSIKAFRIVKAAVPDAHLILTGSKFIIDWGATQQRDIAYFLELIKFLDLQNDITIDFFRLDEMPHLYSLSKVCIYPSTVPEPFGLTMLEANATAKPMIVSNIGGMPEIIQNDINGYVVPVRDFEALAGQIIQVLRSKKLRERLGTTGREIVEVHYTKEIMAENTLKVYRRVLS